MIAIHPSHVATVNEVFTPSAETVVFYQGMVAAYEEAAAGGTGALRYRGLHIDKAHYDKAVEWLERAARLRGTKGEGS
jgi:citrate lyase subunit beta/citryl-CoA lyase